MAKETRETFKRLGRDDFTDPLLSSTLRHVFELKQKITRVFNTTRFLYDNFFVRTNSDRFSMDVVFIRIATKDCLEMAMNT